MRIQPNFNSHFAYLNFVEDSIKSYVEDFNKGLRQINAPFRIRIENDKETHSWVISKGYKNDFITKGMCISYFEDLQEKENLDGLAKHYQESSNTDTFKNDFDELMQEYGKIAKEPVIKEPNECFVVYKTRNLLNKEYTIKSRYSVHDRPVDSIYIPKIDDLKSHDGHLPDIFKMSFYNNMTALLTPEELTFCQAYADKDLDMHVNTISFSQP